jgi:hypothetical protein
MIYEIRAIISIQLISILYYSCKAIRCYLVHAPNTECLNLVHALFE